MRVIVIAVAMLATLVRSASLGSFASLGSNATAMSLSAYGRMARLHSACQQTVDVAHGSADKLKKLTECVDYLKSVAEATRVKRMNSYRAYRTYAKEMVAADGLMKYLQDKHGQEKDKFSSFESVERKLSDRLSRHFNGKSPNDGLTASATEAQAFKGEDDGGDEDSAGAAAASAVAGRVSAAVSRKSDGDRHPLQAAPIARIDENVSDASLSIMAEDNSGNNSDSDGLSVLADEGRTTLLQASQDEGSKEEAPSHLRGAQNRPNSVTQLAQAGRAQAAPPRDVKKTSQELQVGQVALPVVPSPTKSSQEEHSAQSVNGVMATETAGSHGADGAATLTGSGETEVASSVGEAGQEEARVVPDEPVEVETLEGLQESTPIENAPVPVVAAVADAVADSRDDLSNGDASSFTDVSIQEEAPPLDADVDGRTSVDDEEMADVADDADDEP